MTRLARTLENLRIHLDNEQRDVQRELLLAKAETAGYIEGRRNLHRTHKIYVGEEATRWLKGWRRGQVEFKERWSL